PEPVRDRAPAVPPIGGGGRTRGGALWVTGPDASEDDPAARVEVSAEAQRHGASLSLATAELVRTSLPLLAAARAEPAVSAAFLRILRGRGHIAETLLEMHQLGVLKTLFPEFGHLEWLIPHHPFPIYTLHPPPLLALPH